MQFSLFHQIYTSDLLYLSVIMLILLIAWSVFSAIFFKNMQIIGTILAVFSIVVIIYGTLLSRTSGVRTYDLIPFSSFYKAVEQREIYRSMLMNIYLFMPLGFSLPFVFKGSTTKRLFLTLLCGFCLSVVIETTQFFFSLGLAETDDVICNTVGTALGSCSYLLSLLWRKMIRKAGKGKDR